jgi:hypothetical protein
VSELRIEWHFLAHISVAHSPHSDTVEAILHYLLLNGISPDKVDRTPCNRTITFTTTIETANELCMFLWFLFLGMDQHALTLSS